ncbi:MAG: hypothetical protein QM783_07330 [Phycisphaerales bacterium]
MTLRSFVLLAATASLAIPTVASQPDLLNIDSGSWLSGGASPGAQDFWLDPVHRGVTAGGAARVSSPFGWSLHADQAAIDHLSGRKFGPVDLFTGSVTYSDTQLVLPATAPWPIGTSYNSAQTSGHVGGGMQGNNWFQSSQPSVTKPDSNNIIRLFYSANAFTEYKQIDTSSYYAGINGAGGIIKISNATEGSRTIELYTLNDEAGNEIVFFGYAGVANSAEGQIWKYTVAKGTLTGGTEAVAYVKSATAPYTASRLGYNKGHIVVAFDSSGHEFDYSYVTIGAGIRLASVTATTGGTTPTTIATVQYNYYGDSVVGSAPNNGVASDLAMVQVTFPTSFPASGGSPVIQDLRENRFYYDSSSRMKLMLGYEGTRRHLVATAGSPVSWNANATTLASALNALAELRVTYTTGTSPVISSAWFGGMDGSGTAPFEQPNGQCDFTYETTAYTTPWQRRTIVKQPSFTRYAGSDFASPSATAGNVWTTQYFDSAGQPLSSVVSDIDPATTTTPLPRFWVTGVERDANHRLSAIHSPANCTAYDHNAASSSRGSFTTGTNGLVTQIERYTSGDTIGLANGIRRRDGSGTSVPYVAAYDRSMHNVVLATGSPTVTLRRPQTDHSYVYPVATTTRTDSTRIDTQYTYVWWTGATDTLVPRSVLTTLPAVDTSHNGSGVANDTKTWFDHYGRSIVTRNPNGRLDATEYHATTGVVTAVTTDSPVPSFPDLPSGEVTVATIGEETTPYGLRTEYKCDDLGRVQQKVENAENSTNSRMSKSYYTRLSDRRLVRLDVPAVDSPGGGGSITYYGPFTATVYNHLGLTEESGLISPSDPTAHSSSNPSRFSTTNAPRTWLTDPVATPTEEHLTDVVQDSNAAGLPKLISFNFQRVSDDGSRPLESRVYTNVPATGLGARSSFSSPANFDRSLTHYNGMGLVDRYQDVTDTISLYSFDTVGRSVRVTRGTAESGAGVNMRPVSSTVFDSTTYNGTTAALNVAGGNGQVTQIWQHPSGSFGGTGDIHSYVRYNQRGDVTDIWRDGGPFLASATDNLGRATDAAAFDGSVSSWNTSAIAPSATSSGTGEPRLRFAQSFFDELGRVYRNANYAVDPTTGSASALTDPETVRNDVYYAKSGAVKFVDGTQPTQYTLNRVCQVTTTTTIAQNFTSTATAADRYTAFTTNNLSNAVVITQTNVYYDENHHNVIATVQAQRGSNNVTSTGVVTSGNPNVRGPLMDVPNVPSQTGWLGINPPSGGTLHWTTPTTDWRPELLLNISTTDYDHFLDIPVRWRNFGDPLRLATPFDTVCCGANCDPGSVFPAGNAAPFIERDAEYDPRRVMCKTITTDWESGDRRMQATIFDAAGQPLKKIGVRTRVDVSSSTIFPDAPHTLPSDVLPPDLSEHGGGCCGETERDDLLWDRGRLKLEKMFLCDPPVSMENFNPNSDGDFCSPTGCPKATSHGYPDDLVGWPSAGLPWQTWGDPAPIPNDNNRELWNVKPIGESPDLAWHTGDPTGSDDSDWTVCDDMGRPVRIYRHQYRSTNFGDGNAASGTPAEYIDWGAGGYPTEIKRPSGDITSPWEHINTQLDMLGRPKVILHDMGPFSLGTITTHDDEIDFGYDNFGKIKHVSQKFKGMFPSGCSGPGTIDYDIIRAGTPTEPVMVGGRPLTPWQGPRVVRQTTPFPNIEVGMAYFPNPAGTVDTTGPGNMYPPGGGGYVPLLVEPRLDWALGRPQGIYQGNGTNHYLNPVSQYGYLGMAVPLHRYLPQVDLNQWDMLPTQYAAHRHARRRHRPPAARWARLDAPRPRRHVAQGDRRHPQRRRPVPGRQDRGPRRHPLALGQHHLLPRPGDEPRLQQRHFTGDRLRHQRARRVLPSRLQRSAHLLAQRPGHQVEQEPS